MHVRAYLRASTDEQDAQRARDSLGEFARKMGAPIAATYAENVSGAKEDRPELRRLLADALPGDILLIESVDRLSRLPQKQWTELRQSIDRKGLRIVAKDLPTTHLAFKASDSPDATDWVLGAISGLMLEIMAASAREDYERRRERQAQGIAKAKAEGKFTGRAIDKDKDAKVRELLLRGMGVRQTARFVGCSPSLVYRVMDRMKAEGMDVSGLKALAAERLRRITCPASDEF
ncbi:recombinase family protein [Pseudomonas benzopyrenica]|uniref:recombinase family protein n=1 Tax=Pseudomonas benzopyrenica TaxID=2993566 RepID=UPI003F17D739